MNSDLRNNCERFKTAVQKSSLKEAGEVLSALKKQLIMLDSLPPMNVNTPNATEERQIARTVYEQAALYAIKSSDKDEFQRYAAALRPYYSADAKGSTSDSKLAVISLKLLYLLVENRLSDFHCEIELLSENELLHPYIKFCTQIEQQIMVGLYNQVLNAANNPPLPEQSFFLQSLMETVRLNVADCAQVSYKSLRLDEATKMLMFGSNKETVQFIQDFYPSWTVAGSTVSAATAGIATGASVIDFHDPNKEKGSKAEGIPSNKIISQVLTYATELERIV